MLLGIEGFDASGAVPSSPDLGELVIHSDITITAGEAALVRIGRQIGDDGSLETSRLDHRVLRIDSGDVTISNLIIQRGQTAEGEYGAGIWNAGSLTLRNSIVGDNVQRAGSTLIGGGGGIYNAPTGTLAVVNSVVGSVQLNPETLDSLGIDPAEFPTGNNGMPLLVTGNTSEGPGGGIFNEGEIRVSADSSVSFNEVAAGGNSKFGGGIFNAGSLDIVDSLVGYNVVPTATGAKGGGIYSSKQIPRGNVVDMAPGPVAVTIATSTLESNRAGNGGAIHVDVNTSLMATESTFSQNIADTGPLGDGGAIDNDGTAMVIRSTVMNNVAEQNGGGIHTTGTLLLESSTVSTNGSFNGVSTNTGGGVYVASGTTDVINSTIAFNTSTGTAGGVRNIGTIHFDNSIISNNSAGSGPNGYSTGTVTAVNSLVTNNTSNSGAFLPSGNGNLINVDPLLGPLGGHGGPTFTHALMPGSPAIDSSYTDLSGRPETDQRGVSRLVGPAVDRGAFESEPPATMRVDSLSDEVNGYYGPGDFTLREAVLWAKRIPGPDSIGFSRELVRLLEDQSPQDRRFLELTGGQIVLDSDVTIRGPGADILSIDADADSRIFLVSAGANVEISGITLTNASSGGSNGGAVDNEGNLTLRDVVVANSSAGIGGGIYSNTTGTLTLDTVYVAANTANGGGGIYLSKGATSIVNSTISDNTSTSSGGGILVAANVHFTAENTTISANRSDASAGGIYFDINTVNDLNNVTITDNYADESENQNSITDGGGIWKSSSANVKLHNTIVWGNFSSRATNDVEGSLNLSSSYNLIGIGGGLANNQNGNHVGVTNAFLGPLRNAGGPTPTHALRPGSPAIDAGDPNSFPLYDQRGTMRPVDGLPLDANAARADIGAYEYVPPVLPNPIIVDTLSGVSDGIYGPGQVSLGDAIAFANTNPTHNQIVFDPALFIVDDDAAIDEDAVVNLVQALPVTAAASSFYPGDEPQQAIDGDLGTSWFTATNDAANKGASPWFEVDFGEDVIVTHITMRSTRVNPTGLDFIKGRFDVYDAAGIVLFSQVVTLPELLLPPEKRDLQLDIPDQADVRRVRFTSLMDEGATPGFAELEVYGTSGVIGLEGEQLVVTDDLTITGPGADLLTISGNRKNRIFRIEDGGNGTPTVTISGATLTNGRLRRNYGEDANGGAIWNSGDLTLLDVYVANNSIEEYRFNGIAGRGGGIYNTGTLTLENTTIALNSTVNDGGGLYNAGTLDSLNSTFSTNLAKPTTADSSPSPEGGGLFNASGATVHLQYTTITLNEVDRADGTHKGSGIYNAGTLALDNTIVAENGTAPSFGDDGWTTGAGSSSTSLGHNLIGSSQNFGLTATTGDHFGSAANHLDPLLSELVSINGSVPMHGLLPTSLAVDGGNSADFPATDQRGLPRPVNGDPDIGAYELQPYTWGSELVVDSFSDKLDADYSPGSLTLREAILWANALDGTMVTDGVDRITFDLSMIQQLADGDFGTNTLVLNGKQLDISDDLEIVDPGSVLDVPVAGADIFRISGDNKTRVLMVELGATVAIAGLAFADGNPPASDPIRDGGAIRNLGDLKLTRVIVESSRAQNNGGGIYNGAGVLTIEHSTISGNRTAAGNGGGIYNVSGEMHINASTIAGNQAGDSGLVIGGGIAHFGSEATISASAIYGNSAQQGGGGIAVSGAQATMAIFNSTISNNRTLLTTSQFNGFGGGVFAGFNAAVELVHVTIAENTANVQGGGISLQGASTTLTIGNSIVATNHVTGGGNAADVYVNVSIGPTAFESLGHNLFGMNTIVGGTAVATDIMTASPELGPLADNGGPTRTHLLKPSSPAIDAADIMISSAIFPMRLTDQRGLPMVDIPNLGAVDDIPDIGAYEVQGIGSSAWEYQALDQSQFGPGPALVYGFGFDEGVPNSSINPDPYFLGFQFDTGPQSAGHVVNGPFGTKFGGELNWDLSGKLGFNLGFYINSGSVDVNYDGDVNYVVDQYPSNNKAGISTFVDVADGNLFTVSPKIGAYADLVIELNADVSAIAYLFGPIGADLLNIHFKHTEELFALNRQVMDEAGLPMFFDHQGDAFARNSANGKFYYPDYGDSGDPNNGAQVSAALQQQLESEGVVPILDGDIRYFSLGLQDIVDGIEDTKDLKDRVDALVSASDLYKANGEVTKSSNRLEERENELAKAMERRDNASSAEEEAEAESDVKRLSGADGNGGELKEARDAQANAKQKQEERRTSLQRTRKMRPKPLRAPSRRSALASAKQREVCWAPKPIWSLALASMEPTSPKSSEPFKSRCRTSIWSTRRPTTWATCTLRRPTSPSKASWMTSGSWPVPSSTWRPSCPFRLANMRSTSGHCRWESRPSLTCSVRS